MKVSPDQLRTRTLGAVMEEWQERFGAFTDREIADAEADFDRAEALRG